MSVRILIPAVSVVLVAALAVSGPPASAAQQPSPPPTARAMPSDVPATQTPAVNNGSVRAIAQVGSHLVIGGTFTSVDGSTRDHVAAFSATSGALTFGFHPAVNGTVSAVVPGPNDHSVYIGGNFTKVGSASATDVALVDVSTGEVVPGFHAASTNYGHVTDLVHRGDRLYLSGTFTKVGGVAHHGLASLDADTGALDPFMDIQLTGHHNDSPGGARGGVGPKAIDVTADGSRMVVIGNFTDADGLTRDQILEADLTGDHAAVRGSWATDRYSPLCYSWAFDTYMRGVSFSPDGSYFVVTATGGPNAGTLCDAAARWETNASGGDLQPTWVDQTGGDTIWGVTVTGTAVFLGGHQRWMNNPGGHDSSRPGAVPRPGLAALDTTSGRPLAWNPGRHPRGVAVYAVLATDAGLWVGSNTDWIGHYRYKRPKLAFFPYAGGYHVGPGFTGSLPASVYLTGSQAPGMDPGGLSAVAFDGTTASDRTPRLDGGIDWAKARGAFIVDGKVFYGWTDGYLHERTFQDGKFGTDSRVDPYHDPYWDSFQTGSGQTYAGTLPSFYGQLGNITGMFYDAGRLYYTLGGDSRLHWRWFSPDSGIVDESSFTADSTVNFSNAGGMILDDGTLYYANRSNGDLAKVAFDNGAVHGSSTVVSGPGKDGTDWRARGMFIGGGDAPPENAAPVAKFGSDCSTASCTFDASDSSDPDGDTLTYAWTFGDGESGSGAKPTHTYAETGNYTVALTVTDPTGASDSVSHEVDLESPPAEDVGFVGTAHSSDGSSRGKEVKVPAGAESGDTLLLFGTVASDATASDPTGVSGWTQVGTFTNHSITSKVWIKTAEAGDAGATVRVNYNRYRKGVLSVAAYSGVDVGDLAMAHAGDSRTTEHTTPNVDAGAGDWVLSYWADKSAGVTAWSAPDGVAVRDQFVGRGGGRYSMLLADSGGAVDAGQYGGLTATNDTASGKAIMWTVGLPAAGP